MAKAALRSVIRDLVSAQGLGGLPDRHLLERFITHKDEAAFAALVERHGAMVLGVAWNVLQHQQDAEDVFQAVFLVLARKAGSVRKQGSAGSWLHGVAYRLALKARTAAAARRRCEARAPAPVPGQSPDDLTWRELSGILHEELERLPDRYRAPLVLCYLEGMTQDQAAEHLDLAQGTLKGRLERARLLLRGRLSRRGLAPAVVLLADTYRPVGAALPAPLVSATARAAEAFAAGQAAGVSVQVAQMTEGALKAMFVTKLRSAALLLLAVGLVSGTAVLAARGTPQDEEAKAREAAARAAAEKEAAVKAARQKETPTFPTPAKAEDLKVDFEEVSVSIRPSFLASKMPESIRVRGDGVCEYRIEERPARGAEPPWDPAFLEHKLNLEHLRRLEAILKKTDWLQAPGHEGRATHLHPTKYGLTLKRKGQTRTITIDGEKPEPYKSLLTFFEAIALQENVLYRLERAPTREQIGARREIDQYVRAERGEPYGKPSFEIDLRRYAPTFEREVRRPFDRPAEELAPAVRLLGHLRSESEREHIVALANDRDSNVRAAVAEALGALGGKESVAVLRRMVHSTNEAPWELIRLGPLAVPTIVEVIESGTDPFNERQPGFLDYQRQIRAYLDHWDKVPRPIDPRVLEAVRQSMARPKIKAYGTQYHQQLLDLASGPK